MGHSLEFWNTSSSGCEYLVTFTFVRNQRFSQAYGRISNPALQNLMPARTTLYQNIPTSSLSLLSSALGRILMDVDGLSVTWDDSRQSCLVHARANSWSRAARRMKPAVSSQPHSFSPVDMQCWIYCRTNESNQKHRLGAVYLEYQWVEGRERGVFDSFFNHINRKVSSVAVT